MFILFFIAGMILAFGIYLLITRIKFIRKGTITEATVVERYIVKSTDPEDSDTLHLTFKFYTPDNQEIVFKREFGVSDGWQIGDKEIIVYQTYNPERVVLLDFWDSFGVITILLSVVLILILIATGYYWSQHFFNSL
jgi:hypothetical protein